jgi:hypothetical protein
LKRKSIRKFKLVTLLWYKYLADEDTRRNHIVTAKLEIEEKEI